MKSTKLGAAKLGPGQQEVRPYLAVEPIYTDFEGLKAMTSISKGKAYPIIARGDIKVVKLREPGRSRGRILINVASVKAYLERLAVEQEVRA